MVHVWQPVFYCVITLFLLLFTFLIQDFSISCLTLSLLLVLNVIIYSHVRKGRGSKQMLLFKSKELTVINRLFPFRYTRKYVISSLQIVPIQPWNIFTGHKKPFESNYGRLLINSNVQLIHLYKLTDLDELIKKYERANNKITSEMI